MRERIKNKQMLGFIKTNGRQSKRGNRCEQRRVVGQKPHHHHDHHLDRSGRSGVEHWPNHVESHRLCGQEPFNRPEKGYWRTEKSDYSLEQEKRRLQHRIRKLKRRLWMLTHQMGDHTHHQRRTSAEHLYRRA